MPKFKRTSLSALLAVLLLLSSLLSLAGCASAAIKLDDQKVSPDLLRYFVMNYRRDLGYTADQYKADPAKAEELETLVHTALREIMAYRALAEEYDLELSKEEKADIEASVDSLKEGYADEAEYEASMKESYLTEAVYMELQELQLLAQKVYDHVTAERNQLIVSDDATVDADIAAGNFFSAEYLYVYYSDRDKEEKVAFAQDLHKELLAGTATMKELDDRYAAEYGLSMEYILLGAFTYTQQEESFEELILSLKEQEYSEPVVRGDGILIARRLALSDAYVQEHYDELIECYKEREFAYFVRDYGNKMELTYQGDYQDTPLWEMK